MNSRHYAPLVSFRGQPGNERALPYVYQHTCSPTCWGDLSSGDEVCPSVKSRSEGNRSEVRTSLLSVTLSGLLIRELMPSRWEKGGPMEGYEPRRCSSWNSGGGGMIGSIVGKKSKLNGPNGSNGYGSGGGSPFIGALSLMWGPLFRRCWEDINWPSDLEVLCGSNPGNMWGVTGDFGVL